MAKTINPSSREVYVLGAFDCGCEYESSFGSVELIRCSNQKEVEDIKKMMLHHSSEYQCNFRGALVLLVFEGKFSFKQGGSVKSYKSFVRTWKARGREGRKMTSDLRQMDKLWDRKWNWMERVRKRDEKIKVQEDLNTGVGVT